MAYYLFIITISFNSAMNTSVVGWQTWGHNRRSKPSALVFGELHLFAVGFLTNGGLNVLESSKKGELEQED